MRERNAGGRRGLLGWLLLAAIIAGWLFGATPGRGGSGSLGAPAVARADVRAHAPGRPALGPNQADVTVSGRARMKAIPHEFLGISTEYTTLPLVEQHSDTWQQLLGQLSDPSDGRLPVRIGGDSAEHVLYNPGKPIQLAPWEKAYVPSPGLLKQTATIIDENRMDVILDMNTITGNPRLMAKYWRELARQKFPLGRGRIVGLELGNEPDIYSQQAWCGGLLKGPIEHSSVKPRSCRDLKLPKRITARSFANTYQKYARALYSVAPTGPLLAPALAKATDHLGWIKTLLRHRTKMLQVISAHVYPYSACAKPGQAHYPTIQKVLSENATAGMVRTIRPALKLARKAGLSLRLTEVNSVTCGGRRGVSDTFATALWAPDALFELLRAGVQGVHLHARVESINRPFSFNQQGLQTRPLLYGLLLFNRMLGWGARLVPVQMRTGSRALHLKVWVTRASATELEGTSFIPNPLNVLLINKGRRSARITLHLPTRRRAFVERLLARSASSTSGVTLEGQHLNHQGLWQQGNQSSYFPLQKPQILRPTRNGSYVLRVRGESAAMLTVPVAASTLAARACHCSGPRGFGYE